MTGIRRRDGRPIWLNSDQELATPLERVDLGSTAASGYNEAWLQELLHQQPAVFPVDQIEPGFGDLIPLCRELPLMFGAGRSGALDNVFVTSSGGLVLVEAKLWRNPEARRSVVAQAMEYAGAVFRLSYDEFEQTVLRARKSEQMRGESIFQLVAGIDPSIDEAEFIDALSRNLSRGRAIVAVVGDGIREDIVPLAELLQSHAGQRFTFALVELAVFQAPNPDIRVVVPSVLAQTILIERGVVRVDDETSTVRIDPPQLESDRRSTQVVRRGVSIGEDEFYDLLAQRDPAAPDLLKRFLERAYNLGIYVDRQAGLNLKHESGDDRPLNLGTISKAGFVDTGPASWWGRTEAATDYNRRLADAIGGRVGDMMDGEQCVLRTSSGKTPRLTDLLPAHEEAWLSAMETYIRELGDEEA